MSLRIKARQINLPIRLGSDDLGLKPREQIHSGSVLDYLNQSPYVQWEKDQGSRTYYRINGQQFQVSNNRNGQLGGPTLINLLAALETASGVNAATHLENIRKLKKH